MLQTVSTAGTNLVISLFNEYVFISFDFTVFEFIFAEKFLLLAVFEPVKGLQGSN